MIATVRIAKPAGVQRPCLRCKANKVSFHHNDCLWLVVVPVGLRLYHCLRLSVLPATWFDFKPLFEMVIADAVRIVDTLTIHNRLPLVGVEDGNRILRSVQEWKTGTGSSVPSKRPRDDRPPPDRKAKKSTISKQGPNDKELQRLARQFGRCFDCGLHPEGSLETHRKECV
jgi:hypothetical protein